MRLQFLIRYYQIYNIPVVDPFHYSLAPTARNIFTFNQNLSALPSVILGLYGFQQQIATLNELAKIHHNLSNSLFLNRFSVVYTHVLQAGHMPDVLKNCT